jgi:putative transposase
VICGAVQYCKSKPLAIYCNPDHAHLFVGLHPTFSPSKLMEMVKSGSSKWINTQQILPGKFAWQSGFGAFTYSKSQIDSVVKYILNQPLHHQHKSFKEEYLEFLDEFEIDFNEAYLFDW